MKSKLFATGNDVPDPNKPQPEPARTAPPSLKVDGDEGREAPEKFDPKVK